MLLPSSIIYPALCNQRPAERMLQIAYAKCHVDWAKKNLETWKEAGLEVAKIEAR